METKMLAPHPPGGSHHRGYSAPGVEKVSQHVFDEGEIAKLREIPDYKESFESGNPLDTSQPNIWPPESILPDFQHFLETYFSHCSTLIHRLLDALTLALHLNYQHTLSEKGCGVSEEMEEVPDLSSTHANSLFQLRLLHYPPISARKINAHSDFGTLTLLFQDTVGGLEVQTPNNQDTFTPAPPIPDTVLVNIGDLLARWSNDRWRSTVHRVVAPPPSSSAAGDKNVRRKERNGLDVAIPSRYSIPFFATADMDTVIEALPGCWDADAEQHGGRRKLYEPVTAWGYVQMRMKALYEG
ncbi:unnamed protein product [Periconia digitata]|uniref:Fe2OG dioxygenase domain-containing protein n=1 Tax=Periconia digitata TaxID=1303443 RepID=A0A9W4UQ19_9PLEO|nr:unnamed protein product [Periconia digitata]